MLCPRDTRAKLYKAGVARVYTGSMQALSFDLRTYFGILRYETAIYIGDALHAGFKRDLNSRTSYSVLCRAVATM